MGEFILLILDALGWMLNPKDPEKRGIKAFIIVFLIMLLTIASIAYIAYVLIW